MISMELSGVQRNTETSAEHNAAIERFLAQGGTIHVLEGFVVKPKPPAAAYSRKFPVAKKAKPVDAPKPKRTATVPCVQVPDAVLEELRIRAPSMSRLAAEKEFGFGRHIMRRLAAENGFKFKEHDPRPNLTGRPVDPVADALDVVRIKGARDRGLTRKAACKELGISKVKMRRLIGQYNIDYPVRHPSQ
ncbi:hypothetical protein [Pseudomonas syringae group sp. J309-1]|uniref:hypothetical protein n=1 Tax=Pseudomonas syringae group sp. J309-1 TaxID=3079588 RepID=UPI00290A70EE|nr:hypothetical protein [Pseudomonas syringae group sp. J309-1]MDU8358021.1 hypothetical protein [Pseudomonas syringae group sp. J309-1]